MLELMERQLSQQSKLRVGVETFQADYVSDLLARSTEILYRYRNVKHLFLDNLWLLQSRPALASALCDILQQRRAAGKMTVVTSDLELEAWQNHCPQLAAILSEAESFRLQRPAPRNITAADVIAGDEY